MSKTRFKNIDLLRGIAIVVMILTHTNAYFWTKWSSLIWNYIHFAVPTFVFCSGFVLANRYPIDQLTVKNYFKFIKKRFIRLLLPYYIFILAYYVMVYLNVHKIDFLDIQKALIVIREPDISWLVNLFLQLTLLFPFLSYLFSQKRKWFNFVFIASFIYAFLKIFLVLKLDYKMIMVFSWSVPFMLAFYVQEKYSNTNFKIKLFLGFLALQIFLRIYLFYKGSNLIYQDNKYPPNLYYLSYGISWFLFLDLLFNKFKFFSNEYLYKIVNFFSTNSFTLFFLQYLVIQSTFRFIKFIKFNPFSLFFWVIFWCVFLQLGINFLNKKNNSKISKY